MVYSNVLSFLWALLIALFAIPSIIYVAHLKKLLDTPNNRTVHEVLTPRLGGLAIFAAFASALTVFGDFTDSVQKMFAGLIVIFFIGLKDDITPISAFKKSFVQLLAAGIIIFLADVRITAFQGLFGIESIPDGFSYAFTFFVIIGLTNAVNLIDGINGLAGATTAVSVFFFGLCFALVPGISYDPYTYVCFSLMGALMGFLRYNWREARIFMGDTGSLVSGYTLACLAIILLESGHHQNWPLKSHPILMSVGILFIPIVDTLKVFAMRIYKGISPFTPDKNHLHHRLLSLGLNHEQSALILVAVQLATIALLWWMPIEEANVQALILGAWTLFVVLLLELLHLRSVKSAGA